MLLCKPCVEAHVHCFSSICCHSPYFGAAHSLLCTSCPACVLQAVQTVPLYGVLSALKLFRPKVQQQPIPAAAAAAAAASEQQLGSSS
jgi:hypothetical protein